MEEKSNFLQIIGNYDMMSLLLELLQDVLNDVEDLEKEA